MGKPVSNLKDLEKRIAELPPPKKGYARVYRGQAEHRPKLLSSTCRPNAISKGFLWKLALLNIPDLTDPNTISDDFQEFADSFMIWWEALIQHYGPGSPYLDVSTSIEVALWFAMHKVDRKVHHSYYKFTGHPPIPFEIPTLNFQARSDGTAWLYVLDVPFWNGDSRPTHGEYIDLLKGPDIVSSCLRAQRQAGGLLYGDIDASGGDLASFLACDPIEVSCKFEGADLLNKDPEYIFPPPEEDEIFTVILKAPLVPYPDDMYGYSYKQSLDAYLLSSTPEIKEDNSAVVLQLDRLSLLSRIRLRIHPTLLTSLMKEFITSPEDATYIQLQAPLYTALPSSDLWNQALLQNGISRSVPTILRGGYNYQPMRTLENVLIDFSPLETAFLNTTAEQNLLTSVWLQIQGHKYCCTYLFTDKSLVDISSATIDFSYSEEKGQFEVMQKGELVPLLESAVPEVWTKYFFISLYILQGLSPGIGPEPFCYATIGKKGIVAVRGRSTILSRSKLDPEDMNLHFLLNAGTGTEYEGPTMDLPVEDTLLIEPADKFQTFRSLQECYGHATLKEGEGPLRNKEGFDPEIADYLMRKYT